MKSNGRHGRLPPAAPPRRFLPTVPSLIGAALFLFFTSQLFTTSPFGVLIHPSAAPSEAGSSAGRAAGRGGRATVYVPPDSHAYLRPRFSELGADAFVANVSRWYDPQDEEAAKQVGGQQWTQQASPPGLRCSALASLCPLISLPSHRPLSPT